MYKSGLRYGAYDAELDELSAVLKENRIKKNRTNNSPEKEHPPVSSAPQKRSVTIEVDKGVGETYTAHFVGNCHYYAEGKNSNEAIGALISSVPAKFGIKIVYC